MRRLLAAGLSLLVGAWLLVAADPPARTALRFEVTVAKGLLPGPRDGRVLVVLGRQALLAQHPPAPPRGRPSLFERAERIGGQDGTGWIVYRIAKGDGMPADVVSS